MVVDVNYDSGFVPQTPRRVFGYRGASSTGQPRSHLFDVTPGGDFVLIEYSVPEPEQATQIHVVINWFDELKRLVPTDR